MSTITTPQKRVNFLVNEKTIDWRFRQYEALNQKENTQNEKVIYWLGIIDLPYFHSEMTTICISFPNKKWELGPDQENARDDDGAEKSLNPQIRFYVWGTPLFKALLDAKREGNFFAHVLLEERVDRHGAHQINLLHNPAEEEKEIIYIIATKKPWYEEPSKNWIEFSSIEIHDGLIRLNLLNQKTYHFMK